MPTPTKAPLLLFVHGTSFCKQIWKPIQHQLEKSPLSQRAQFTSMDLPYHGAKRDNSVRAVVDEVSASVRHPAGDWLARNSAEIYSEILQLYQEDTESGFERRSIIGIGHSVGAATLWNIEAQNPGTFAGLVLFEPIVEKPGTRDPKTQRFMFNTTLNREYRWPNYEAAVRYCEDFKGFASWDRESLKGWREGAIVPEQDGSESVVLACHPTIEASIYCQNWLWLSDHELAKISCPVSFYGGARSKVFAHDYFEKLEQRWPWIYTNHFPMENTSHNLVMENPKACARAILDSIKILDCFNSQEKFEFVG
ncbi:hypothetical protein F441_17856 [Phytophthora nicotianae CJ01A1]|uniref:AB hydrolase-1 domain-containing protein n=1 Tax=Phytophthora nicotianae CJ01A1 TaxID=1317063 RepID=W2W6E7_PHYNI|nr:hypothetical protein F441_17856 [Phytophthora nicotianae CJ01A1]